ncbi:methyl-accepting chemotaxis protein [Limnospira platensis]|uniref:methyl-accepting chemotaxis protein n=1 Tax=Limnospira platensis TaxID=118562 RepID=UPI0002804535|nr:methyl-accepting chemotaxis sensory transducer [Arthrospira platensis C1]UWU50656.1 twitching motility protein PilJ [Arthrospira platensis C1]
MTASAEYLQEYQKTEAAYTDGKLDEAATLVYKLVEDYPEDPFARLLCGHIYYGLQQYDVAREQYEVVLSLTEDPALVEQAEDYLTEASQFCEDSETGSSLGDISLDDEFDDEFDDAQETILEDLSSVGDDANGSLDFDLEEELDLNAIDEQLDELEELTAASQQLGKYPQKPSATIETLDDALDLYDDEDMGMEEIDISSALDDLDELSNLEFEEGTEENLEAIDDDLGDLDRYADELEPENLNGKASVGGEELNDSLEDEFDLEEDNFNPLELEANPLVDDSNFDLDDEVDPDLTNPLNNPFAQGQETDEEEEDPDLNFDLETSDPFVMDEEDELVLTEGLDPEDPMSGSLEQLSEDLFEEDLIDDSHKDSPGTNTPGVTQEHQDSLDDLDDDFSLTDLPLTDGPITNEPIVDNVAEEIKPPDLGDVQDELDIGELELEEDDIFSPLEDMADARHQTVAETNGNGNGKGLVKPDQISLNKTPNNNLDEEEENFSDFNLDGDKINDSVSEELELDDIPDTFDLDSLEESTVSNGTANGAIAHNKTNQTSGSQVNEFLEDFEEFDDVEGFGIPDAAGYAFMPDSADLDDDDLDSNFLGRSSSIPDNDSSAIYEDDVFNTPTEREAITAFSNLSEDSVDTNISVEQGSFAFLENKPLRSKSFYIALGSGLVTLIAVAVATNIATKVAASSYQGEVVNYLRRSGWLMTIVAGASSFGTAFAMGRITSQQLEKATGDLQKQFDAIARGNLNARVNVYAEDELGQMCAKFNYMAQFIESTTREAQRKAEEQEEAKENLQRQVIRLLDDVEGAARGDLTVSAEVTADVLGAVADSFNLTIQNLREIVVQVKQAARQVSRGATDSASFAKDVAGDALRQAEELAATLNSVQLLTDAIQRVADSAKEAEEVARTAAAVATKGGEAVEMTVAGILKIRETVAETTRDVKRLAESSQEISKIVAIISNIASRTNLLALNASIEAARAGEAGRGFAIVADEVRQLADKSAKSLKEIEQIVMQIQSQTSSVMMAMEEGNQQVIEGTRLAEQAKRSLDDIIQVTNRIDVLVRSITADTVEQNETARAVAEVMQAVELSAQDTSQEAQRVASALSNLVGVARDLLTSVERFRVDPSEH